MNGEPAVLNISALLAKNGATPLSPNIPININTAPNTTIGLADIWDKTASDNVPVAARMIDAPPNNGRLHIIAIKP